MFQVYIEFRRIQSYLFHGNRLKWMIGANALLGEVIRIMLPQAAKECGSSIGSLYDYLEPHLTRGDPLDPLFAGDSKDSTNSDSPKSLFLDGTVSRDGGHFRAVFDDQTKAQSFYKRAMEIIDEFLPGLAYSISQGTLGEKADFYSRVEEEHLPQLPQLQVCQELGDSPADERLFLPAEKGLAKEVKYISSVVGNTNEYALRFNNNTSRDIVGLLTDHLPRLGKDPPDLSHMVGNGYLALVTIDGNDMGNRYHEFMETTHKSDREYQNDHRYLYKEALGEKFWYTNRAAFRISLIEALHHTFQKKEDYQPFQVLMLGGDDLLMVCRAEYALSFVVHFARCLNTCPIFGETKTTVAAGVVVSRPTLPIYRLHQSG